MLRVQGADRKLNDLLRMSFNNAVSHGRAEVYAVQDSITIAFALGWMDDDGRWRCKPELVKAIDVTPNLIRVRVRQPSDFKDSTFRIITLDESRGIRAVIGVPKGETSTAMQSILFSRDKGWTVVSAEKWVRDHNMSPV